jgi:hypothetical protein
MHIDITKLSEAQLTELNHQIVTRLRYLRKRSINPVPCAERAGVLSTPVDLLIQSYLGASSMRHGNRAS